MHDSPLAFESVTYASVMSMVFGSLLWIMFRGGVRIPGMRVLALSWYMTSIYFFLLATTAGHNAVLLRTQIAFFERAWLILTFTVFAIAYALIFHSFMVANDRRRWLW